MIKNRYLINSMLEDLNDRKMVFIGGPRQVGKTTMASDLLAKHFKRSAYFNWDKRADRKRIIQSAWPADCDLLIVDEFHKYKKWKSFIKGEYDTLKNRFRFILTGSARMDVFRKGGDSLQGRYHYFRLHPFSVAELENSNNNIPPFTELAIPTTSSSQTFEQLDTFGGFPEPFSKANARFLRRWHNEKVDRLFREDIQDVAIIRDIGSMKLLADMLTDRIGSLLSTNALREDLEVSFRAVSHWLDVLEAFYYHFRIYPFTSKKIRSLKKEPKLYLWDWSEVQNEANRFENCIAVHLFKFVNYLYDNEGYKASLHFIRDLNKKEIDFLVTVDNKPWFAVEVKLNKTDPSSTLSLFKKKWSIPFCYQVVKKSGVDILQNDIRITSADRFLLALV